MTAFHGGEPGDAGAVERDTLLHELPLETRDRHGHVMQGAKEVGELEVDLLDSVFVRVVGDCVQ
jgi:hypothetical protein